MKACLLGLTALSLAVAAPVEAQGSKRRANDTDPLSGLRYIEIAATCGRAQMAKGIPDLAAKMRVEYDSVVSMLMEGIRARDESDKLTADMMCGLVSVGMDEASAVIAWGKGDSVVEQSSSGGTTSLHVFTDGRSYLLQGGKVVQVTTVR